MVLESLEECVRLVDGPLEECQSRPWNYKCIPVHKTCRSKVPCLPRGRLNPLEEWLPDLKDFLVGVFGYPKAMTHA